MFLSVIVIAIIIGYIMRGSIKNLDSLKINAVYLVFIAFLIEAVMLMLIRKEYLYRGTLTYSINLIMYIILFVFIYQNRYNKWLLLMGVGFLFNALAIFLNGGAMPVSSTVLTKLGMTHNISAEGLYVLMGANTKLTFLADIVALKFPKPYVISIGDIVEAIAVAGFIITEMKSKQYKSNLTA